MRRAGLLASLQFHRLERNEFGRGTEDDAASRRDWKRTVVDTLENLFTTPAQERSPRIILTLPNPG